MKLTQLVDKKPAPTPAFLAVSVDSHEDSVRLIREFDEEPKQFPIRLLEDRKHRVIDRYGLRNGGSRKGIPHPGTFVIDRHGIVRWRFVETDYSVRPSNEDVLEALRSATAGP